MKSKSTSVGYLFSLERVKPVNWSRHLSWYIPVFLFYASRFTHDFPFCLGSGVEETVWNPSEKTNVSKNKIVTTEFRKNPNVSPQKWSTIRIWEWVQQYEDLGTVFDETFELQVDALCKKSLDSFLIGNLGLKYVNLLIRIDLSLFYLGFYSFCVWFYCFIGLLLSEECTLNCLKGIIKFWSFGDLKMKKTISIPSLCEYLGFSVLLGYLGILLLQLLLSRL